MNCVKTKQMHLYIDKHYFFSVLHNIRLRLRMPDLDDDNSDLTDDDSNSDDDMENDQNNAREGAAFRDAYIEAHF